LQEAEARLGGALPEILRTFYRLAGKREDITAAHNRLFAPAELRMDDTVLLLCDDEQSFLHWGIDRSNGENPDPPVVAADDAERLLWKPFQERLSDYLVGLTVWQGVLGGMAEGSTGVTTREAIDRVASDWEPVPELAAWGMEGYIQPDRACVFAVTTVGYETALTAYAGGATTEDLAAVGEVFGIAWNE
jgi:hypothetical protein